jgi:hypothetical protein
MLALGAGHLRRHAMQVSRFQNRVTVFAQKAASENLPSSASITSVGVNWRTTSAEY